MITLETLKFLQSQAGFELLEEYRLADTSDANALKLLTQLRKRCSPENAAAVLETLRLRLEGWDKFGKYSEKMFFTRDALEQASHPEAHAIHQHIMQMSTDGDAYILDLGCGIGTDTARFSEDYNVIGIDIDLLRLKMAQHNVKQLPFGWSFKETHIDFIQADITKPIPLSFMEPRIIKTVRSFNPMRAAFFDPARRKNGKRVFSVNDYTPPLSIIDQWPFEILLVKLSPGVDLEELYQFDGTIHFVSVYGELKEALLIRGGRIDNGKMSAWVSYGGSLTHGISVVQLEATNIPSPPLRNPQGYLYEPDPAIIRTGLLGELAKELEITMYRMDETIAYLTADTYVKSILARAWIIDDWMPFNLKKLRAYLRERNVGRVTVKKRGSPITPEELIAQLKLSGNGEERVVVLTHVMGQPAVLICRTIEHS